MTKELKNLLLKLVKSFNKKDLEFINIFVELVDYNIKHYFYGVTIEKIEDNEYEVIIYPGVKGIRNFYDVLVGYDNDLAEEEFYEFSIFTSRPAGVMELDWHYGNKKRSLSGNEYDRVYNLAQCFYNILNSDQNEINIDSSSYIISIDMNERTYQVQNKIFNHNVVTNFVPLNVVNKEIYEELKDINKTEDEYILSSMNFSRLNDTLEHFYLYTYAKYNNVLSDSLIVSEYNKDNTWLFLLNNFRKYGLPKILYVSDILIYSIIYKTLTKLGIEVKYNRYDNHHKFYLRDLLLFVQGYMNSEYSEYQVLDDNVIPNLNEIATNSITILRNFILDGYDPENQKLGNDEKEYYELYQDLLDNEANFQKENDNNLVS